MENVTESIKAESLKSFQSTIRKSENALTSMTEKGANTTLVAKRLKAIRIGLGRAGICLGSKAPHLHPGRIGGNPHHSCRFASVDRGHLCQIEARQPAKNPSGKKDQVPGTGCSGDG